MAPCRCASRPCASRSTRRNAWSRQRPASTPWSLLQLVRVQGRHVSRADRVGRRVLAGDDAKGVASLGDLLPETVLELRALADRSNVLSDGHLAHHLLGLCG